MLAVALAGWLVVPGDVRQRLTIEAAVDYGFADASVVAPELSIAAPDGRAYGFEHAEIRDSGYVRYGSSEESDDPADTGGPRTLWLSPSVDGAYALDVIATTTGHYDLKITANVSIDGSEIEATRAVNDVPMVAGARHRYDVEYALEGNGAVRLRLVARDAPAPPPPERMDSLTPELQWPSRSELTVYTGPTCSGTAPTPVRLITPAGRSVGFERNGAERKVAASDVEVRDHGPDDDVRGFVVPQPADGEFVIEIMPGQVPTPYFLHVSFAGAGARYEIRPWETGDCARKAVAPGSLHRWVVRLKSHDPVPLRLVDGPADRRPRLPPACPFPGPAAVPDLR